MNRFVSYVQQRDPAVNWRSVPTSLGGRLVSRGWSYKAAPDHLAVELVKKSDSLYREIVSAEDWTLFCTAYDAVRAGSAVLALLHKFEAAENGWVEARYPGLVVQSSLSDLQQDWYHRSRQARAEAWAQLLTLMYAHPAAAVEWLVELIEFETD